MQVTDFVDEIDGAPPLGVPVIEGDLAPPGTGRGARRALATRTVHQVAQALGGRLVGPLAPVGWGLWHEVWAGRVQLPDSTALLDWVLRLPHGPASAPHDGRLIKEARLLPWLVAQGLAVEVPSPVALVRTGLGLASVQTRVSTTPVPPDGLIEVIAEGAARVHRVPVPAGAGWIERYPTRRDHALERLATCRAVPLGPTQAAADWIAAHLPPATPAVVLHGDLMAHNHAVAADGGRVLLDWTEALIGDAAFELCLVTRAVRRPLGHGDGRRRLLDAYHAAGGDEGVTREHLYLQELALTAEWLSVPARPQDHDDALARLVRLLAHLGA